MIKYAALPPAFTARRTGKLRMAGLRTMCTGAGFVRIKTYIETYIASGGVIFESGAGNNGGPADRENRLGPAGIKRFAPDIEKSQ
jgi:uncharacterized protein (DUF1697 family)